MEHLRALLTLRRDRIAPLLSDHGHEHASYETGQKGSVRVCWWLSGKMRLHLFANLAATPAENVEWTASGEPLHAVGCELTIAAPGRRIDIMPPWSVLFTLEGSRSSR
jgi:hypothetical protein